MTGEAVLKRLAAGGVVILDGAVGTELERRGAPMNPGAWCGAASIEHYETLIEVHLAYIEAGADLITANTYASNRLMLEAAGLADRFEDLNRAAIEAAFEARRRAGRPDIAVAGSLSHMAPMQAGGAGVDRARLPDEAAMAAAFEEMAQLLASAGCDLILLEMMYQPERLAPAFAAAERAGLPYWAGFAARRGPKGEVLAFTQDDAIPLAEALAVLRDHRPDAAGIMHTPADLVGDALAILREHYDGPLTAYPDSGYFEMPHWRFDPTMTPEKLRVFAESWLAGGARAIGGCCGLTPAHIAALAPLRDARPGQATPTRRV